MRWHVVVLKSEVGAVLRISEESFMFMGLNVSFVTEQCTLNLVISFFLIKPNWTLKKIDLSKYDKSPIEIITLSHTEVLRHWQKLDTNKSSRPDNLHPRLLKETAAIIAEPLRRIFQTSLTSRELPADWKIANITLVFLKDNHSKPENYWPISLTSVNVKMLECIVNDSILKHLTTNKILSPKQHGFQSGKSIETNLLESYKEIIDLIDHGHLVDLSPAGLC